MKVKFTCLVLGGDGASQNIRCKCHIADKFRYHNLFHPREPVLLLDVCCMSHNMTRIEVRTFQYEQLIPKVYNMCFINRFPPRYNRLVLVIAKLVRTDLNAGGFILDLEAPAAGLEHEKVVANDAASTDLYTGSDKWHCLQRGEISPAG